MRFLIEIYTRENAKRTPELNLKTKTEIGI